MGIIMQAEEIDHHIPLHRGGSNDISNLVPLCREHHRLKSEAERAARADTRPEGWRRLVEEFSAAR